MLDLEAEVKKLKLAVEMLGRTSSGAFENGYWVKLCGKYLMLFMVVDIGTVNLSAAGLLYFSDPQDRIKFPKRFSAKPAISYSVLSTEADLNLGFLDDTGDTEYTEGFKYWSYKTSVVNNVKLEILAFGKSE